MLVSIQIAGANAPRTTAHASSRNFTFEDAAADCSRRTSQDFRSSVDAQDSISLRARIEIHGYNLHLRFGGVFENFSRQDGTGTRPGKQALYRLDRYLGRTRTVVEEPSPLLPAHAAEEADI